MSTKTGTKKYAWFGVCILAVFVALMVGGTAPGAPTAISSSSMTYQDSTGENPAAPDIASVVVSNDDAGLISFAIRFANRSALGEQELVGAWIDTDAQATTGEPPIGVDYSIMYGGGGSFLGRWDAGKQEYVAAPMSTLRTDWADSTLTMHVNTSELGGTSSFKFGLMSFANPEDENAPVDLAPAGMPLWQYTAQFAPVVAINALTVTPQPAVLGKAMVAKAAVAVTRLGKPETLPTTAVWKAVIGTQQLVPASMSTDAGGAPVASWNLPRTATAKSVQITLTVTAEGVTATKTQRVPVVYQTPVVRITSIGCTPTPARAGKIMLGKAQVVVIRGGVREPLPSNAKVKWTATSGALRLKPMSTKVGAGSVLTSSWKLPKTMAAKTVRVSLTVNVGGVSVTKTHLHPVR